MIFSYLTLIRLEDMSVAVFRKFVFSQVQPRDKSDTSSYQLPADIADD